MLELGFSVLSETSSSIGYHSMFQTHGGLGQTLDQRVRETWNGYPSIVVPRILGLACVQTLLLSGGGSGGSRGVSTVSMEAPFESLLSARSRGRRLLKNID